MVDRLPRIITFDEFGVDERSDLPAIGAAMVGIGAVDVHLYDRPDQTESRYLPARELPGAEQDHDSAVLSAKCFGGPGASYPNAHG